MSDESTDHVEFLRQRALTWRKIGQEKLAERYEAIGLELFALRAENAELRKALVERENDGD